MAEELPFSMLEPYYSTPADLTFDLKRHFFPIRPHPFPPGWIFRDPTDALKKFRSETQEMTVGKWGYFTWLKRSTSKNAKLEEKVKELKVIALRKIDEDEAVANLADPTKEYCSRVKTAKYREARREAIFRKVERNLVKAKEAVTQAEEELTEAGKLHAGLEKIPSDR